MRLTLLFPAWCEQFGEFRAVARKASSFPPLTLAYVAAVAEQAGWEAQIIDAEAEQITSEATVERIRAFKPDLIGYTATTPVFHIVARSAQFIRERIKAPIVVGGPHISLLREEAFLPQFDYLCIGECEATLPAFLQQIASGNLSPQAPGFMSRKDGAVVRAEDAPRLQDLDAVPFPARHLLPNDRYHVGTLRGTLNYTSLAMSRGCPFNCVFCANDLYGKKVRRRSVRNVMRELDLVVRGMGIKHVYLLDDCLTLDRAFILSLCDEIERSGLSFTFEGSTRANLWDESMVRRLKGCGLIRISFGLETADPVVRRIIRKEIPMDAYIQANRLNTQLGIETINSVMLGLPGETRGSIRQTVAFLCSARDIQHATYSIAQPYPGTELLDMARNGAHGLKLIDTDFAHYQRYGSAPMQVGGIPPAELVSLQKIGLMKIYLCWWRWLPMIKRHGLRALIKPAAAAFWSAARHVLRSVVRPGWGREPG